MVAMQYRKGYAFNNPDPAAAARATKTMREFEARARSVRSLSVKVTVYSGRKRVGEERFFFKRGVGMLIVKPVEERDLDKVVSTSAGVCIVRRGGRSETLPGDAIKSLLPTALRCLQSPGPSGGCRCAYHIRRRAHHGR